MGGYRLEDRGEVEDQNVMIVDDHDCEKDFDEKRMDINKRGEVYNNGCIHAVDDNDDDDISNCCDNGDRGDYFGVKVLMSMVMIMMVHHYDQVSVKGKGAMITYWLVGEEPALRAARCLA